MYNFVCCVYLYIIYRAQRERETSRYRRVYFDKVKETTTRVLKGKVCPKEGTTLKCESRKRSEREESGLESRISPAPRGRGGGAAPGSRT